MTTYLDTACAATEIAAAQAARRAAKPALNFHGLTLAEAQRLADFAIGREHTHTQQPYGTERFTIQKASPRQCVQGRDDGWTLDVQGIVIEGSETSYLGGHRSTSNTAGRWSTVYGMKASEIAAARSLHASCG